MPTQPHHVLITDPSVNPAGIMRLEPVANVTILSADATEANLIEAVRDVDAILARTGAITRSVIEAAPKLKIISRHGVGFDNVDLEAATQHGVMVTITANANAISVSEHALGCMLTVANRLAVADNRSKAGEWTRNQMIGVELHGKILGIVGLGRVGSRLARLAQGFEMEILAHDPFLTIDQVQSCGATQVDLNTLLQRADFISIHTPLTDNTRNQIDANALATMKSTAILVNTARGGIVDEPALYEALINGQIAGAALDVFVQEPISSNQPPPNLDNLLCTPHVAGSTQESLVRVSIDAAENILTVLRGETPEHIVNTDIH